MKIENKVVSYKHSSGIEFNKTWFELMFSCLESPPKNGFTSLSMMKKRMDLQDKLEPIIKLEKEADFSEKEIDILKSAVEEFAFAFNSRGIIEFKEFFQNINK